MYFCSGQLMHFCSGVDTPATIRIEYGPGVNMKTKTFGIALTLVLLQCASVTFSADQIAVVEVQDEPRHHGVFENAFVRILEVEIAPGDTTLYHRHRRTNVAVAMGDGERSAQLLGSEMSAVTPTAQGDVLLQRAEGEGLVHRVHDAGGTPLRFTDIEFIKPTGNSANPNSIAVKPTSENEFYRAYTLTLAPSETSPPLILGPGIHVILVGPQLQRIDKEGHVTAIDTTVHAWQWHEAGTSRFRNAGPSTARMVEIELK
jgi:hypothetical protein